MGNGMSRIRALVAGSVVLIAVVGLVIAALLADGRAASQSDLNDGGAWLVNRSQSSIGHANRVVGEIGAVANPFSGAFDVEQADGVVLVHDRGAGQALLIDTQNSEKQSPVSVPESSVIRVAGRWVVLHEPETGSIWRFDSDAFEEVQELDEVEPTMVSSPASRLAVGVDGVVSVADPVTSVLTVVSDQGNVDTVLDRSWSGAAVRDVTRVGATTVVALDDGRLVAVDGDEERILADDIDVLVLQQPSAASPTVTAVVASGDVVRVDLASGEVITSERLAGGGPLPPIEHQGCSWVVTLEPTPALHHCGESSDLRNAGQNVKLVLVNGWVWVNDADSGSIWFVREDNTLDSMSELEWTAALARSDEQSQTSSEAGGEEEEVRNDNAEELVDDIDALDDDDINTDPVARDDEAATRRGRAVMVDALMNDSDEDGDPLVIEAVSDLVISGADPAQVRIDPASDGRTVQVQPPADFVGQLRFTYTVHDGRGGRDSAVVTLTVVERDQATNRPPVAKIDNATVRAGSSTSLNVLANDTDPDGDILSLVSVGEREGGRVTFTPDGQVTFSPDATSTDGTVDLGYTIEDDFSLAADGVIRIRVRGADSNQAPQGRNDVGRTSVGRSVLIRVLDNDLDPDGDPLVAQNLQTQNGSQTTARLTPDGNFIYLPETAGTHLFSYVVSDGPQVDTAQIRVDVDPQQDNRPPVAVVDELAVAIGERRLVRVLDNDGDPDGDVVGIVDMEGADGLEIDQVEGIGFFVRALPSAGPRTAFRYWISDGLADPVMGMVIVSAVDREPVDYPPIARGDVVELRQAQTSQVRVLNNDYDPEVGVLRIVQVGPPDEDEATVQISADQQVLLVRVDERQEFGFDFGYTIEDEAGNRASAVVTVRVVSRNQPNRAPIAGADIARTAEGLGVDIRVLDNDIDPDGDPIAVESIAEQPRHGTVALDEGGVVTYTPEPGFSGTDSFVYTLVDGYQAPADSTLPDAQRRQGRSRGEVFVGVMPAPPENNPPSAVDDSGFAPIPIGGSTVRLPVLTNDSDPDRDPIVVAAVSPVAVGEAAVGGNGQWIDYTPPAEGESREVAFSYTVADGRDGTDTAVVTLRLEARPDPIPPVAVGDTIGPYLAGELVTFDPRGNDIDADGPRSELRVESLDPAMVANNDGTVTITVPEEQRELAYRVIDVQGLPSQPGYITVTVTPNRPPVTSTIAREVAFNESVEIDIHPFVSDPDLDPLDITLGTQRVGGSVSIVGQPRPNFLRVRFTPNTDHEGEARFDYGVDDRNGHFVSDQVVITVLPPDNRAPEARPTTVEAVAGIDSILRLPTLVTDQDPDGADQHTFTVSDPAEGNIRLTATADGEVRIASNVTDGGRTDSFTYTVDDAGEHQVSNTVTVTLTAPDFPPPSLTEDRERIRQGESTGPIAVLENDTSNAPDATLEGDGLTVVDHGVTEAGQVDQIGETLVFTPNADFFGLATFTYTVQDGRRSADHESTSIVTVEVVGLPDQPQPPVVSARGADYVVLTWTAPTGDAARAPVEDYELRWTGGGGGSHTLGGAITTYRVENLTPGTEYCFTVSAINEVGQGPFSDSPGTTECATPDTPPEAPPPPQQPAFGCGYLDLSWTEPANQGSAITQYVLRISGGESRNIILPATASTYRLEGLTNGTPYAFEVLAENAEGQGPWSQISEAEHPLCPPPAPPQPQVERGDRQLTITWQAPADNGDPIDRYEIRSPEVGSGWVTVTAQGATNQYVWNNLPNGQEVTFEVRAWNRDPVAGATSPPSDPLQPCGVPDAPPAPTVVRDDQALLVSWAEPPDQGCAIDEYWITANGGDRRVVGVGVTSYLFDGLTNGTTYDIRVAATNLMVTGGLAEQYSPPTSGTPAGPPFVTSITEARNTAARTVQVSWAPAGDNGSTITHYELQVNGGTWQDVGTATTHTDSGLSNGTSYSYRVRAVNDVGPADPSAQSSVTTWDVPAAPPRPSATAPANSRTVSISWSAPASDRPITRYQVDWSTTGSRNGVDRTLTSRSTSFTGSYNTTYYIWVRAENEVGWGPWSARASVTPRQTQWNVSIDGSDTCPESNFSAPDNWNDGACNGEPGGGWIARNTAIVVTCRTTGYNVSGISTWYRKSGGSYSGWYVWGGSIVGSTSGIPVC